jgi:hypothetical protein
LFHTLSQFFDGGPQLLKFPAQLLIRSVGARAARTVEPVGSLLLTATGEFLFKALHDLGKSCSVQVLHGLLKVPNAFFGPSVDLLLCSPSALHAITSLRLPASPGIEFAPDLGQPLAQLLSLLLSAGLPGFLEPPLQVTLLFLQSRHSFVHHSWSANHRARFAPHSVRLTHNLSGFLQPPFALEHPSLAFKVGSMILHVLGQGRWVLLSPGRQGQNRPSKDCAEQEIPSQNECRNHKPLHNHG